MTLTDLIVEKIEIVGGLYFRTIVLPVEGLRIPQHTHDHEHVTFVGHGRARGYCDGVCIGDKGRGEAFEVKAGHQHAFESLEADTLLTCIHNVESAMSLQRKGL